MRKLISLLLLLSLLITPVFAHPGRTDENGGHWDRSTGEYHYHHGYSEHQHYDMNGDGIPDCPYDFHDATRKSNSSGSTSVTSTTELTPYEYESDYSAVEPPVPHKKKMSEGLKIFLVAILQLGVSWAIVIKLCSLD